MGGSGIQLPYNAISWSVAALSIFITLCCVMLSSRFRVTKSMIWYLLVVSILLFPLLYTNRLFLDVEANRLLGLGAGILFLFCLYQFRTINFRNSVLLILFSSTLIQTIWGLVQYYFIFESNFLFYRAEDGVPYGIFQQVNVFSSFLALGSLLALYYFFNRPYSAKSFIFTALVLAANFHLTALSGADSARVVAVFSVILYITFSIFSFKSPKWPILILATLVTIAFLPNRWFDVRANQLAQTNISEQVSDVAQTSLAKASENKDLPVMSSNADASVLGTRATIYYVALQMIMDKPLLGHGIGSFTKQYLLYQGRYLQEHPDAPAEFALNHAHNEVLQWAIELGLVSASAFVVLLIAWLYLLRKGNINPAILLLAMPFVFQSMLELPLYHSAPHFLAFMAIIAISSNERGRRVKLPKLTKFLTIPLFTWSFVKVQIFLLSTLYALLMFLQFNQSDREQVKYLLDVNNPAAFKLRFEFELFQWKLRETQRTKTITKQDLLNYIYWAFSTTQYAPMQSTYENFIEALRLYGNDKAALDYANEGVLMYPKNTKIKQYQQELASKFN